MCTHTCCIIGCISAAEHAGDWWHQCGNLFSIRWWDACSVLGWTRWTIYYSAQWWRVQICWHSQRLADRDDDRFLPNPWKTQTRSTAMPILHWENTVSKRVLKKPSSNTEGVGGGGSKGPPGGINKNLLRVHPNRLSANWCIQTRTTKRCIVWTRNGRTNILANCQRTNLRISKLHPGAKREKHAAIWGDTKL